VPSTNSNVCQSPTNGDASQLPANSDFSQLPTTSNAADISTRPTGNSAIKAGQNIATWSRALLLPAPQVLTDLVTYLNGICN